MTALLLCRGLGPGVGVGATPLARRMLSGGSRTGTSAANGLTVAGVGDTALSSGSALQALPAYDERWLQELLFAHPELLLIERMEAGAGALVPLCRELAIPRLDGVVFLDLLCVTRTGRLVLVECKLWRNPQARREVVAQILEYAALLRGWSFGDLTARLKQRHGYAGENPIFEAARQRWGDLDEATFTDGVARSLQLGDFNLIIAGDGIRADLQAVATHLGSQGGLSRLSLLEIQLWTDDAGRTLVVPSVPLRTEVITQRVLMTASGQPLVVEEPTQTSGSISGRGSELERTADPAAASLRADNRAFWQRFIDSVRFDHPDQLPPRHGGNNWVQLDVPGAPSGITVYRSGDPVRELGIFLRLRGEDGRRVYDDLAGSLAELSAESGLAITASIEKAEPFAGTFGAYRTTDVPGDEDAQLRWLIDTANRFTNAVRLRL